MQTIRRESTIRESVAIVKGWGGRGCGEGWGFGQAGSAV